jgi:predicted RecA/RadA family phage recombinase
MEAQFVHDGDAVDYVPPADVDAGDVVVLGRLVGVAKTAIKAGVRGAVAVKGVYDVSKTAGPVFALGDAVYWDAATSLATPTQASNKLLGTAVVAAGATDGKVRLRLGP